MYAMATGFSCPSKHENRLFLCSIISRESDFALMFTPLLFLLETRFLPAEIAAKGALLLDELFTQRL
jgi:hypothetical protein